MLSLHYLSTLAVALVSAGLVSAQLAPPAEFTAAPNPSGRGGGVYKDSPHFRINGASDAKASNAILQLEAAYECFIETLGWRSTGLSNLEAQADGTYYKTNVYQVNGLGGAAGAMSADGRTGLAFLNALPEYIDRAGVMVHEYGHVMTYHEQTWVDQGNTGAWWETVANFVSDTYENSPLCAAARRAHNQPESTVTNINLDKLLVNAHRPLVDGSQGVGNYYEAWPFLAYLTNNPDGLAGLGNDTVRQLFRQYATGSNETPLHTLERVAGSSSTSSSVQAIVGAYWARMANVDIGHKQASAVFEARKARLALANVDPAGPGAWRVKADKRPNYMGANIVPLRVISGGGGTVQARVQTVWPGKMTASLAVRGPSGTRYVTLQGTVGDASGSVQVAAGEQVSLVVANTPEVLVYDPFKVQGSQAMWGLDWSVTLSGATA